MALPSWALIEVSELKDELDIPPGPSSTLDTRLERAIRRASDRVQKHCGRTFIDSGTSLVEFHTMPDGLEALYPLDYPVVGAILELNEDPNLAYGATTILDAASYV